MQKKKILTYSLCTSLWVNTVAESRKGSAYPHGSDWSGGPGKDIGPTKPRRSDTLLLLSQLGREVLAISLHLQQLLS